MPLFDKDKDKDSKKADDAEKNVSLAIHTASGTTTDSAETAAKAFGDQFIGDTSVEDRADKIHDTVTKFTDQYANAKALYTTNKDIIQGAWDAMAGATGLGRTIDDWIGPISKVMTGLEGLAKAQPFPFVELAVKLFNGVLNLEVQRRQNSAKTRALILQMADMMGALLQLHFIKDPTLIMTGERTVAGRIQELMKGIEKDISDVGNLINKYHEHSLAAKFFRSGQFATSFKAAGDILVTRKGDIIYACTIHTTVTVDEIRKQVYQTNTMIQKLTDIVKHQSEKEKEWERLVKQNGSRERVLGNPDLAMQLAAQIEGRDPEEDKAKQEPGKAKDSSKPAVLADGELAFNRSELRELKQPLEKILQDSLPYYEKKLQAQMKVIEDQIARSTQQILNRLDAGSYEKIGQPDIRILWKDMGWRTSVKARQFVMGLHDHYLDRYAAASHKENATTITTTTTLTVTLTSPGESVSASPIEEAGSPTSLEFKFDQTSTSKKAPLDPTPDASIIADKDYLQYLAMPYIAAIIEAFDEDASGFIRITEVNDFCATIPAGWTLLQWIAFWAHGWRVEASYYSALIGEIIGGMNEHLGNALAENNNMIYRYLTDGDWTGVVKKLAFSAHENSDCRTDSSLDYLVKAHMAQKEEQLEKKLEGFNFYLDAPESISLVIDSGRVEKDLFSLLFVVLRRHLRLIALAKTKVLEEDEMSSAWYTIFRIVQHIQGRVEELQYKFKHEGLDVDIAMSKHAGGVYEYLHTDKVPDGIEELEVPEWESDTVRDMLLPNDLDLSQFSKSNLWFDLSAYADGETEGEPDATGNDSSNAESTEEEAAASTQLKQYRAPLVIPDAPELASTATEHKVNLAEIWSEVTSFITKLTDQLNKGSWHPAPGALALLRELGDEAQGDYKQNKIGTKIFDNTVQIICAFIQLPDVEDGNAPTGIHDGFIPRLTKVLEPVCNELAYILRLYKAYHKASAPPESADAGGPDSGAADGDTPAPVAAAPTIVSSVDTVVDPELMSMVDDRMSRHAPLVVATIDAHTGSGIIRFRGAAYSVQSQIEDHRYRYTGAFLRRRRTLRKLFVEASALTMNIYRYNPEAVETYNTLLQEIPSIDQLLYASLARMTYRRTIVHPGRYCDSCRLDLLGPRYVCVFCYVQSHATRWDPLDFDLCDNCASLRLQKVHDIRGKLHHVWHPLIRCSRQMVEISSSHRRDFETMFEGLNEGKTMSEIFYYEPSIDEPSSAPDKSGDRDEGESNTNEAIDKEQDGGAERPDTNAPEENGDNPVVNKDDDELKNTTIPVPLDEPSSAPGKSGDEDEGERNTNEAIDKEEDGGTERPAANEPEENGNNPVVNKDDDKLKNTTGSGNVAEGQNDNEKNVTSRDFGDSESGDAKSEENETPVSHDFICANCKKTKTGTRFLKLPRYKASQYCPECAEKLMTPEQNKPLDIGFRLLLKCTIPRPDDDEVSTIAGEVEVEKDQPQPLEKRLTTIDDRLVTLENRFNDLEQKIQGRLDQILSILAVLHPSISHEIAAITDQADAGKAG